MDIIPLGAVIPPVASLNFFLVFCLALIFDWHSPAQFVLPLLITLPCAYLGAMLERRQYARNDTCLEPLHSWMLSPTTGQSPGRIIMHSLVQTALLQAGLFLLLFSLVYVVMLSGVEECFTNIFSKAQVSWRFLFGFAAIGAIVALRTRRAYAALALSIGLLLICNGLGWL